MNKGLKIYTRVVGALAVLLPCLVVADVPNNMALGEVDAILKFCGKTDPRFEKDAEATLNLLTGKASPTARSSAQYKQGYDLMTEGLQKANKAQVLAACAQGLAPRTHGEGGGLHGLR
jgi:hypothetical protein